MNLQRMIERGHVVQPQRGRHIGAQPLCGPVREPEPVGEQEVVQRAMDRLEKGAAVGTALAIAQAAGVRVQALVHPAVVACLAFDPGLQASAFNAGSGARR
jgi:hypothetical protein